MNLLKVVLPAAASNHFRIIILAGICASLASCYSPRYVYSPATQNIPVLSGKGNFDAGAAFATGGGAGNSKSHGYNLGLDAKAAYAVTNHAALMMSQYNRWEKNSGDNNFSAGDSAILIYKRHLTEFGAGYYTHLKNTRGNSVFQVFAGLAFGKFRINDNNLNYGNHFLRHHYSTITKVFIQPAVIISGPKNSTASFSSRFSEVFYRKVQTDYTATELDRYLLSGLSSSPVFFWEPAFEYSISPKKIKGLTFQFQGSLCVLLNHRFVDYRSFNLAAGIVANNDLFKRKSK